RPLGEGSRGNVDADAADVPVARLDLAGVDGRPNLETQVRERLPEAKRAAKRASWRVESRQDPVTGGLDEVAVPSANFRPSDVVVLVQQLAPRAVAHCRRALGGA